MDVVQEAAWDRVVSEVRAAAQVVASVPTMDTLPTSTIPTAEFAIAGAQPVPVQTDTPVPGVTDTPWPTYTPLPTNTPQPTATPPPTNTPAPRIGVDVTVGSIVWHFHTAENLGNTLASDDEFTDDSVTSGKFIRVTFDVANRGNDMNSYSGIDLVDNQGRQFTSYSASHRYIPDDQECFLIVNINPGLSVRCTEIFELPVDATGLKAHVGDLEMFGGDEAYIDLGL
jgi:hypothetical protein